MQAEKCDRNWDDLFFLNFLIYNMSTTNLISFLRIFFLLPNHPVSVNVLNLYKWEYDNYFTTITGRLKKKKKIGDTKNTNANLSRTLAV
jgi:hypothetical protein